MASKSSEKYIEAVGKRKTAVARVRIAPAAKSAFSVNGKDMASYFKNEELRTIVDAPFAMANMSGKYDVSIHVRGGGIHSQAEALAHGIARALVLMNNELKAPIKKAGMLARDARIKERRKFGLKKARKSPQWSKR